MTTPNTAAVTIGPFEQQFLDFASEDAKKSLSERLLEDGDLQDLIEVQVPRFMEMTKCNRDEAFEDLLNYAKHVSLVNAYRR